MLGLTGFVASAVIKRPVIAIMAGLGEFKRSLIRVRCDAGIARANAKGVQFGRKAKLDASQRRRLAERYAAGETTRASMGCRSSYGRHGRLPRAQRPGGVSCLGRRVGAFREH